MIDKDPAAALALGNQYAARAAELGMPVAVPGAAAGGSPPVFVMGDVLLLLRYADARGTGQPADLLFVYGKGGSRYVSVVVAMGQAHPLFAEAMNGTAVGEFVDASVEPQPQGAPRIVIHARRNGRRIAESFGWNGDRFVPFN